MKDKNQDSKSSCNITATAESPTYIAQAKVHIINDAKISASASIVSQDANIEAKYCNHNSRLTSPNDLIIHSTQDIQTNTPSQTTISLTNDILSIIWKMASALFTISIIIGFIILNTYSDKINQPDLMFELVNSPASLIMAAILPFIASMFATSPQVFICTAGVQWSELPKRNNKFAIPSCGVFLLLALGVFCLWGVAEVFGYVIASIVFMFSCISFGLATLVKNKLWWAHCLLFIFTFCAIGLWSVDQINNENFKIVQSFGVADDPRNAKWYILHPTTNSNAINGFQDIDIKQIKNQFNTGAQYSSENDWSQNPTAVFGYMQWNIGSERVLCSTTPDQICIRISKDNIQPAPFKPNDQNNSNNKNTSAISEAEQSSSTTNTQ